MQAAPSRHEVRNAARLVWANWAAADENNYERAATLAAPILDWPADQPPDIASFAPSWPCSSALGASCAIVRPRLTPLR